VPIPVEVWSSDPANQRPQAGKGKTLHILHNMATSDKPGVHYPGVDVIAQLHINMESLVPDINQASENCTSVSLLCRRYGGLLKPVWIEAIHPILFSHPLAPCIIPDWAVVEIGHPRISSSLLMLIYQWLSYSRPRANVFIITVIISLIAWLYYDSHSE